MNLWSRAWRLKPVPLDDVPVDLKLGNLDRLGGLSDPTKRRRPSALPEYLATADHEYLEDVSYRDRIAYTSSTREDGPQHRAATWRVQVAPPNAVLALEDLLSRRDELTADWARDDRAEVA